MGHGNFQLLAADLPPDSQSQALPTLLADETYQFRVRAMAPGESAYSDPLQYTAPSMLENTGPLRDLSIIGNTMHFTNDSQVEVVVTPVARTHQSSTPDDWLNLGTFSVYPGQTSLALPSWPDFAWSDRWVYLDQGWDDGQGGWGWARTNAAQWPPASRGVAAPSNLTQSVDANGVLTLSWTDNSAGQADGFEIWWADTFSTTWGSPLWGTTGTSITFSHDEYPPEYFGWAQGLGDFVVQAWKQWDGTSYFSNAVFAPGSPPAAPANPSGVVVPNSQISLVWDDPATNETSATVEMSTDGLNWSGVGSAPADENTLLVSTTIQANVVYRFRVANHNPAGDSAYSSIAQVTVPLVSVSASDDVAIEGDPGDALTFHFTRTGDTSQALEFSYTIGGSATLGSDHTLNQYGSLTFDPDEATVDLTFVPLNDTEPEWTETVTASVDLETSAPYRPGSVQHRHRRDR